MTALQTIGVIGSPNSLELAILPAEYGSAIAFRARHKLEVYCPEAFGGCGDRLVVRVGEVRVPHLAHYGDRRCDWLTEPDRDKHLRIQLLLRDWAIQQGYEASIEYVLERARTDLRISKGDKAHHVEVQLSPIPTDEMVQRTLRYAAMGATVTWLCGEQVRLRQLGRAGRSLSIRPEEAGLQIRWAPLPGLGEYEPLSMWRLDEDDGLRHREHDSRVAVLRRGLLRDIAAGLQGLHPKRVQDAERARRAADEQARRQRQREAARQRRREREEKEAATRDDDEGTQWPDYLREHALSEVSDAQLQVLAVLPLATQAIMARPESFEKGRPILPDGRPACLMCARFVDGDWCVHPADPDCVTRWLKLTHRLGIAKGCRFSKHAELMSLWVGWTHQHKDEHNTGRRPEIDGPVAEPDDQQGILF